MSHQVEVTKVISATPEHVYALVSDLCRMGEWSPENTGGSWIKGATGPVVGARFEGTNRIGKKKWKTISTVTVAEPGREFGFDVTAMGMKVAGWGFALAPVDGGTEVTHYWDDHRSAVMAKVTGLALSVKDRSSHNATNMETTLDRLAGAI